MNRVLILFAHPALHKSRVNRALGSAVQGIEGVTFHDLYEVYPDLAIDVAREKELLSRHDVIVLQHPFYWYSVPAILKEWLDLVLEYGWAYGEGGTALEDKAWIHALTTGGPEDAYRAQGYNRFSVRQLLAPMDQTAHLCGMHFLPPFIIHGALRLDPGRDIPEAAAAYRRLVETLRDCGNAWARVPAWDRINPHVNELKGLLA